MYLSLDGTATVYVNASLAALNALRGTSFATAPNAPLDREAVARVLFDAVTRVTGQINASRRSNRRFVHVKLDVDDIRRLGEAAPFAWSEYEFKRDGEPLRVSADDRPWRQARTSATVGWNGRETRRVPAASAEQDPISQQRASRQSAATFSSGSSRSPIGCAARRLCSMPAWIRNPFSIARCGCLAGRSSRSRSPFVVVIWWVRRQAPAEKRAA